jgi:hypothetical protein
VAPSTDGSGPLAPPTGGTPTETAPSEPEVDWAKRYGDLKTEFDTRNATNKAAQAKIEAYEKQFGPLQPETATAPPATPWAIPAPAQSPAVPQDYTLTPPAQGVKNAMDEAILSGDAIAYENARQWGQRIGMIPADAPASQVVPQGVTPEQVQAMLQDGFQQQAARSSAVASTVEAARGMFGQEFMAGEVEVGGVKMSREAAFRSQTEQTGQTDAFNTMINLDGQGVMTFLYNQSYAKAMQDLAASASAGQIPSGATVPRPQQPPSSALNEEMKAHGALFAPPKDPSKA